MRETIKAIVEAGGLVNFPFKKGIKDWFGEAKIMQHRLCPSEAMRHCVHWPGGMENFTTLVEAIDFYMKTVFTRRNLALAYVGIRRRVLTANEFDDMKDEEIKALVKHYNDNFFAEDYPFAGKK